MDWIHLAQDRDWWQALENMVMNFQVPCNAGNLLSGFSRRMLLCGVGWLVTLSVGQLVN
jgi:hypothetical protein